MTRKLTKLLGKREILKEQGKIGGWFKVKIANYKFFSHFNSLHRIFALPS